VPSASEASAPSLQPRQLRMPVASAVAQMAGRGSSPVHARLRPLHQQCLGALVMVSSQVGVVHALLVGGNCGSHSWWCRGLQPACARACTTEAAHAQASCTSCHLHGAFARQAAKDTATRCHLHLPMVCWTGACCCTLYRNTLCVANTMYHQTHCCCAACSYSSPLQVPMLTPLPLPTQGAGVVVRQPLSVTLLPLHLHAPHPLETTLRLRLLQRLLTHQASAGVLMTGGASSQASALPMRRPLPLAATAIRFEPQVIVFSHAFITNVSQHDLAKVLQSLQGCCSTLCSVLFGVLSLLCSPC
jgi:hypothetical protein